MLVDVADTCDGAVEGRDADLADGLDTYHREDVDSSREVVDVAGAVGSPCRLGLEWTGLGRLASAVGPAMEEEDGLVNGRGQGRVEGGRGIAPDSSGLAGAGWDMRLLVRPTAAEDIALAACLGRWTLGGRWGGR